MCLIRCYILRSKKLHVSAGSGHHQVLSFDSLKIIQYNSRSGVSDEISTSKPLLQHSTSIMGVWVNHVMIHKYITLESTQRWQKEWESCTKAAITKQYFPTVQERLTL